MKQASAAQMGFIKKLIGERELSAGLTEMVETARTLALSGALSSQGASGLIAALLAAPKSGAPAASEVPEGMHQLGTEIYKVKRARESGRTYAKQLVETSGKWAFEYAAGAVYRLSTETVMPAEEAAKFGHLYGICVNCAAELTDEVSIFYGYGPVCAKNHGWAYSKAEALASLQEVSA